MSESPNDPSREMESYYLRENDELLKGFDNVSQFFRHKA